MQETLQKFWSRRIVRFIFVGSLTTFTNILLITILVKYLNLNTPLLRSLGNAFAAEVCLLLSFFCYRQFVWQAKSFHWHKVLLYELTIYHLSVASVLALRILLLFPLLDWLGIHHALNALIGIALGAASSYALSDKFVFNVRTRSK
jgi:dolichol-phosphate mannosyltransferase